ncbi:MAG TPA: hypothetical protein DF911_02690 [Erysipelotrichaceae bacterium]|jgi:hypothetical protein|nr:hypothetical protein [Galactobacillus timonensis]HCV54910.1 hypothetical protein [Erysipelotrichaceae bacterium]HCW55625.1 hypothetical protein [Erysipelotrichaceae bacterium]
MNSSKKKILIAFALAVAIIIIFYIGARKYTPVATIAVVIAFAGFMRTRHDVSQAEQLGRKVLNEEKKELSDAEPESINVIDASFTKKVSEEEKDTEHDPAGR